MALKLTDLKTDVHNDWCPGCLTGDTLVLSNPAVKAIRDVRPGERVLTAAGEYRQVAARIQHHYSGPMYRVRAKCFGEIKATPEHPFVAVRRTSGRHYHNSGFVEERVPASELRVGDYLVCPVMRKVVDVRTFSLNYKKKARDIRNGVLPELENMDADLLRLAGYYTAEGSVHGRSLIFSFSQSETHLIQNTKALMERIFQLRGKIAEVRRNGVDIVFNSSYLAKAFGSMFGNRAWKKHIPHELMLLPPSKQVELIKGLWRGDGDFRDAKARYSTTSVVLAEQVKLLLLRQGIVPITYVEPAHENHRTAYRLYVSYWRDYNKLAEIVGVPARKDMNRDKRSSVIRNGRSYLPVAQIETFPFDGNVYDLTVNDPAHTFVTSVTASGNCGDFGIEASLKMALTEMPVDINKVALFSGIGCSSKLVHFSIDPIMLALASGFTFIARSYAYNTRHLKEMIKKAVAHKGFALIDALQPCPTYNDINTKEWYGGEDRIDQTTKRPMPRTYDLESTGYNGRITADMSEDEVGRNLLHVIEKSREWGDKIPIGVFYQNETVPIYEERLSERSPSYLKEPPANQQLAKKDGKSVVNLANLSKELLFESLVLAQ